MVATLNQRYSTWGPKASGPPASIASTLSSLWRGLRGRERIYGFRNAITCRQRAAVAAAEYAVSKGAGLERIHEAILQAGRCANPVQYRDRIVWAFITDASELGKTVELLDCAKVAGLRSKSAVHRCIKRLIALGYIEKPKRARSALKVLVPFITDYTILERENQHDASTAPLSNVQAVGS